MGDRRPRQIIGVLAFDQVGPESLERPTHRAVAQQQAVIAGFRALAASAIVTVIARPSSITSSRGAGDDHQVPMRRRLENVAPLVQQIGADAAADLGPALGEVAEQPAAGELAGLGSSRLISGQPERPAKCQRLQAANLSEYFTQCPGPSFASRQKTAEIRHFFKLARRLLLYIASTWFHANEGAVQRFSGPAAPSLFCFRLPPRPAAAARRSRTSPS